MIVSYLIRQSPKHPLQNPPTPYSPAFNPFPIALPPFPIFSDPHQKKVAEYSQNQQFYQDLMRTDRLMQRKIRQLDEEDCKKIFPDQYYSRYASHLQILQFENSVLAQPKQENRKQALFDRISAEPGLHRSSSVARTLQTNTDGNGKRSKLNKYDYVVDTIAKNKEEAIRMAGFVQNLNHKLKEGPSKSAKNIRTPLAGFNQIATSVMEQMKYLENDQYSLQLRRAQEKKSKMNEYVKFRPRSRHHSISASRLSFKMDRSIAADSAESQSIQAREPQSLTRTHVPRAQLSKSIPYQDQIQNVVSQARSQIVHLNPQSKNMPVKCIMAMNSSIRKLNSLEEGKRRERMTRALKERKGSIGSVHRSNFGRTLDRKDLIAMTLEVRKEGERIEMLSRYSDIKRQADLKAFLHQQTA